MLIACLFRFNALAESQAKFAIATTCGIELSCRLGVRSSLIIIAPNVVPMCLSVGVRWCQSFRNIQLVSNIVFEGYINILALLV